nr:TonB-dependent receptor [uncultured Draconibacterium sp.]
MRVKNFVITAMLFLLSATVFGQKGFIRGSVFDGKTGEFLPGVTIFIEGTTTGTITDLDGKFNLPIDPGTYQLRVSFISYETLNINDVVVEANKPTLLDNLKLEEATIQLGEAVVTAKYIRNTETAMITMKRKSGNVMDGISSAALKKIGDSNAAASMKRVTGVSVEGGKYVFVRGLGDRYTKTILNGLDIPGLDPDRNSIQMDIFPTNIIDNMVVTKSFSADLPADFTGGVIDINLKDFPDRKQASVSIDAGYNPESHFNSDFLSYEGGKTDWLGFDDGTRAIPATENIPLFANVVGDPNGVQGTRYQEILHSFNPIMAAEKQKSFMDYGFGASFGNQFRVGKYTLGFILSGSYKSNTDFYEDASYMQWGLSSDANVKELEVRENQLGSFGIENILLSGLGGFAIKTQKAKYRIYVTHLQNGESQAGIFDYEKSNVGTTFSGIQHNLEYSQRSMSNLLIDGKYNFMESGWEIEWKLSPTLSSIQDPDIRFSRYVVRDDDYIMGTESGFPERIWRDLDEIDMAGVLHLTKSFKFKEEDAKLKFGGAYTNKDRDYVIRKFSINPRYLELTGNPNELFFEENIWPSEGNVGRGTTYDVSFIPNNPTEYNSHLQNIAGYVSVDLSPFKNLKAIAGLRAEKFQQYYTGQDQLGYNVLDDELVLDNLDFFPTVNLIYNLVENQNLRFSYAKTIARPSFKELSYAQIFDPISGRTFIGSMSEDIDNESGIVYWDGNLTVTDIQNFDLRWELFQEGGQIFSTSLFYKSFKRPIELVQYATQTGSYQPRNVGDGQVMGVEFEIRKNLQFISEALKNFSVNFNYTYTKSKIELSASEYRSKELNARTGETIDDYRDMAGQAPYLINAGLSYNGGEEGFWSGFGAGIYYNVQGETLEYVGIADLPNVYTSPFHSLNFNSSKSFGKDDHYSIGFKIDNILNESKESVYKSFEAADQIFSRLSPGTTFQFKFGYTF